MRNTIEVSGLRDAIVPLAAREATVDGHPIQGVELLRAAHPTGAIQDLSVLLRPWPTVALFRRHMFTHLADAVTADHWVLPGQQLGVAA